MTAERFAPDTDHLACTSVGPPPIKQSRARVRSKGCVLSVQVVGIVPDDAERVLEHAEFGRLSYWDGPMVATAARAGCTALLSEDMQDGVVHGGVTIRNPFAGEDLPAEIEALLG